MRDNRKRRIIGKKLLKQVVATVVTVTMLGGVVSAAAVEPNERNTTWLYDAAEMEALYLNPDESVVDEYPNGAFMLPISNAELEMEAFYALDIYRQGGTKGDASIKVHTIDLTAEYGIDYEIYESNTNRLNNTPVDGQPMAYYGVMNYSYVPRLVENDVAYGTNEGSIEELTKERKNLSDEIDENLENIPKSSEFTIDFADGENVKTIYIKTMQDEIVSDDLYFTVNLSNPEGGMIGAQTSTAFTIKEEREKEDAQITVLDTEVNPNSEEAYVIVSRGGNLGNFITYKFVTQSGSAEGGVAYESICTEFQFTPGMTEHKIPVTLLEGAETGTEFDVMIENTTEVGVEVVESKATVTFNDQIPITDVVQTPLTLAAEQVEDVEAKSYLSSGDVLLNNDLGMTQSLYHSEAIQKFQGISEEAQMRSSTLESSSLLTKSDSYRNIYYLSLSNLKEVTQTNRGFQYPEGQHKYNKTAHMLFLEYRNWSSTRENAYAARTPERIDFTGVKSISFGAETESSVARDRVCVYVDDDPRFSSNTSNFDFVDQLEGSDGKGDGTGIAYSISALTEDGSYVEFDLSNTDATWGEHYLYFTAYRTNVTGDAGLYFYDGYTYDGELSHGDLEEDISGNDKVGVATPTDDLDHNMALHLQDYKMTVIDPDPITIYENGTKITKVPVQGLKLVDPAATSEGDMMNQTITIYRDEMTIIAEPEYKLDNMDMIGYVFRDPDNTSNVSEMIPFEVDQKGAQYFTLTSELLQKYKEFIGDGNTINIKPIYEGGECHLVVNELSSESEDKRGQTFTLNEDGVSGTYAIDGEKIGTLSWTKSERENGAYIIGDELLFKWEFDKDVTNEIWTFDLNYRYASTEDALSSQKDTTISGINPIPLELKDLYVQVTPEFHLEDTSSVLYVENPNDGDFTGKSDGETEIKDSGMYVHGCIVGSGENKTTVMYSEMVAGEIITFMAKPKDGYRAVWSYTDAATLKTKTYYGNSFFYVVQNAYHEDDNVVTLQFEQIDSSKQRNVKVKGTTSMQEGSILNPPTSSTVTYGVVGHASVTIGGYMGISSEEGTFVLEESAASESTQSATLCIAEDEMIRSLVLYNNQYHTADIDISDYWDVIDEDTLNVDLKMDYRSIGAKPSSIHLYDKNGLDVPAPAELVSSEPYTFRLGLDLQEQDPDKPINMVKWTIESENGIIQEYEDKLVEDENGNPDTISEYKNQFAEIMTVNDEVYVELFHISYDQSGNEVQTTYGRYDTGFTFCTSQVNETYTYAPDIAADPELAVPAPAIGPYSPMFSLEGFMPIFSTETSKDQYGRDISTITIGISYSTMANALAADPSFSTASVAKKKEAMINAVNGYQKYLDSDPIHSVDAGGLKKAANLGTAVKVTLTVTVCFQANYYIADNSSMRFVSSVMILGFGDEVKVSIPFTFFYIPCFTYITAGFQLGVFMNIVPEEEGGSLLISELANPDLSDFEGDCFINTSVGFGLGIGFDALVSASGSLKTSVATTVYNSFDDMTMKLTMEGGITVELLFLKHTWSDDLFEMDIVDTHNIEKTLSNAMDYYNYDILKETTLADMVIKESDITKEEMATTLHALNLRGASIGDEIRLGAYDSLEKPSIISLSDDTYMVTAVVPYHYNIGDTTGTSNGLYYWIIDQSKGCIGEGYLLEELVNDAEEKYADLIAEHATAIREEMALEADDEITMDILTQYLEESGNTKALEKLALIKEDIQAVHEVSKYDMDVQMTDCGDEVLLTWTKAGITLDKDTDNTQLLKSVGIANVYYDKTAGTFHNYNFIKGDSNSIYMKPKVVYNENTKLTQLFYEKMDATNITQETSVSQILETATELETTYVTYKGDSIVGNVEWATPMSIAMSDNAFNYYDVESMDNENILSFVGSAKAGYTLPSIEEFEVDEELNQEGTASYIDEDDYNTVNALYIQKFALNKDGNLEGGQQVELTGDEYVVANPEFTRIQSTVDGKSVDNLLLFYKCNGYYSYQNINSIYIEGLYQDSKGVWKVAEGYKNPMNMTDETDHEINDDFMIVSDHENIYALWTTSEGEQQQIWVRSFLIEDVEEVTEVADLDKNGEIQYTGAVGGAYKTVKLDQSMYMLKGSWGGKVYLTEDGINGSKDEGLFKKDFDAMIDDAGNLVAVYNAYDLSYDSGAEVMVGNQLVLGSYDTASSYKEASGQEEKQTILSDYTPTEGETIEVSSVFEHTGVQNGYDVKVVLYVDGKKANEIQYPTWIAGTTKIITMNYAVPHGVAIDELDFHMELIEDGKTMAKSKNNYSYAKPWLEIDNMQVFPAQKVGEGSDAATYDIVAKIINTGNEDYEGGQYFALMETDQAKLAQTTAQGYEDKGETVVTMYGNTEIPALQVGEQRIIHMTSDEIPVEAFEKSADGNTIFMEGIVTNDSKLDKTTYDASDQITIYNQFNPGVTLLAKDETVDKIEVKDRKVQVGTSEYVSTIVFPHESLIGRNATYSISDESIANVNGVGEVTGLKVGVCELTVEVDGVKATATITVTKEPVIDEEDDEKSPANKDDDAQGDSNGADDIVDSGDQISYTYLLMLLVIMLGSLSGIVLIRRRKKR